MEKICSGHKPCYRKLRWGKGRQQTVAFEGPPAETMHPASALQSAKPPAVKPHAARPHTFNRASKRQQSMQQPAGPHSQTLPKTTCSDKTPPSICFGKSYTGSCMRAAATKQSRRQPDHIWQNEAAIRLHSAQWPEFRHQQPSCKWQPVASRGPRQVIRYPSAAVSYQPQATELHIAAACPLRSPDVHSRRRRHDVQHLAQRVQHPCQSHLCPALSYSHFVNNSVAKGFNTQAHRIQLGLTSLLHPA